MSKKDIYILMYKDYEILSFTVDFRKSRVTFLHKLDHFDKAPYSIRNKEEITNGLNYFFNARTLPHQRKGYKEILKATHSKNEFNLVFKGHGLSLSNHYWFKKIGENLHYEDINFFTNKWDDSFARAVINEDYQALSHVSLNVPDIVTPGWGVKGWLYDENKGPRLYKFGIDNNSEEIMGEVLASRLAKRLFKEEEVVSYDLEMINDKYASVSSPMIGIDDELVPLNCVLPSELYNLYHADKMDKTKRNEFYKKLQEYGYHDMYMFFVKLACLRTICFVNDLHFGNISIIRNINTGKTRMAPLYDLGGSFGSGTTSKKFIANPDKTTLLLIYFVYSNLDPNWDYSWYHKDNLNGFENEIRQILSKSDFYKPEIIDFVVNIYLQQKSALDEISNKNK